MNPVPGLTIEEQPPRIVLTMLAYGEARGEDDDGIAAVVHVVVNRARKRGGDADDLISRAKREALRKWQFSCFNEDDPNRAKLLDAWEKDEGPWRHCAAIVAGVMGGTLPDPTGGATHYFTTKAPKSAKRWPPRWGLPENGWVTTAVIGHHTFGNAA